MAAEASTGRSTARIPKIGETVPGGAFTMTPGGKGAYYSAPEGRGHVPPVPVKAIDTVGAGDTFNGALVVALSEGKGLVDAIRFACKAAAISVTRPGAQTSVPYRREIK